MINIDLIIFTDCDQQDLLTTVERVWLGVWKIMLLGDHLNEAALKDASEELMQLINSTNGNCCTSGRGWLKVNFIY